MAIKVTFLTVVTRIETVERRYPGGMEAYTKDNRIEKPYRDRNITGVLFMSTGEAEEFIEKLVKLGFSYDEIALVDQFFGSFDPATGLRQTSVHILTQAVKIPPAGLKKQTKRNKSQYKKGWLIK